MGRISVRRETCEKVLSNGVPNQSPNTPEDTIHKLGNISGGPLEEIKNKGRKKKGRAMIPPLVKSQA